MADVIDFIPANAGDNPDMVLKNSIGCFDQVLVMGTNKDGDTEVRRNDIPIGEVLLMLERFKMQLIMDSME